ncbi:MAG TPA: hypothetical protein VIK60_01435 [Vicinamibacterales bacterium]
MHIPNVWRAVMNLAGVRLRRLQRHGRTTVHALQRAGKKAIRYGEAIPQVPALARARVQRGQAAIERAGKRVRRFDDHVLAPHRTERRIKRMLARATSEPRPIIVGPWTSEVGYEVLYWLPFLRWAMDRHAVGAERLVALSRGGTAVWYEGIADRYVEIFDLVEPATFAAHVAARAGGGDQKQVTPSKFDRDLITLACQRLGLEGAALWYPGIMYQLFRSFWYGDRSRHFLFRHMDFRYPRIAGTAGELSLPAEYVAVKFYTGPALPDSERNRALLRDLVERLAARVPVVVLDTAWSTDEHCDYAFDGIRGVTTLRPSLDPKTNLGVQTRVVAGARQFVGTCGGLAWLAPFLGVDTLAVYEDDRYLTAHLYAARYAYRRSGAARFSTLNITALRNVGAALATAS